MLVFAKSNMNFCDTFPKENSITGFTYVYVDFDCFHGYQPSFDLKKILCRKYTTELYHVTKCKLNELKLLLVQKS